MGAAKKISYGGFTLITGQREAAMREAHKIWMKEHTKLNYLLSWEGRKSESFGSH